MTAESFLDVYLAALLAGITLWAFVFTVYKPISEYLMRRNGWKQTAPDEWTYSDDDVPDRGIVTEAPARSHRIWARRGHAHAGGRLQVFVDIPGIGWKVVFDEPWPLGACNIECLWNGDLTKLKLAQNGPALTLEELSEDPRTRGNGSVSMHWDGPGTAPRYQSGGMEAGRGQR